MNAVNFNDSNSFRLTALLSSFARHLFWYKYDICSKHICPILVGDKGLDMVAIVSYLSPLPVGPMWIHICTMFLSYSTMAKFHPVNQEFQSCKVFSFLEERKNNSNRVHLTHRNINSIQRAKPIEWRTERQCIDGI